MEIKVKELISGIESNISYDVDKSSNLLFSAMELDYLLVKRNVDCCFEKCVVSLEECRWER